MITEELLKDLLELARALPDPWAFHEICEVIAEWESDHFETDQRNSKAKSDLPSDNAMHLGKDLDFASKRLDL